MRISHLKTLGLSTHETACSRQNVHRLMGNVQHNLDINF
jgi:hypothetical protein